MNSAFRARGRNGFSLVEMMVALGIGMVLIVTITSAYLSSKTAFRRQDQLRDIQQSVGMAFEYLTRDARAAGLRGCQTGRDPGPTVLLPAGLPTNFAVGIEGYDANDAPAYPLTHINTSGNWAANDSTGGSAAALPIPTLSSTGTLTKGSDVLVLRTTGLSMRLTATPAAGATTLDIEAPDDVSVCADKTTARQGGFCSSSYAMITSCSASRVFQVGTATSTGTKVARLTFAGGATLGADAAYPAETAEVFPVQTVAYYVRAAATGPGTSLYRHVFDGNSDEEQELIEGVENMQIRYGVDTTTPDPDGIVDSYVEADAVSLGDWSRVGAVRVSLLVRALDPVNSDITVPSAGTVDGVSVSYPATPKYDRRVFTTTIALRNKASY